MVFDYDYSENTPLQCLLPGCSFRSRRELEVKWHMYLEHRISEKKLSRWSVNGRDKSQITSKPDNRLRIINVKQQTTTERGPLVSEEILENWRW